ncbi:hypothetical protein I6A60_24750 [Frankia sp. AgB1.9]|uniref:reverse transcriptase domain-containing protein n=1 Tax=unclassified Frankia TaxID=2632575 RepID=UPI0019346AC3|nr:MULTISPECIES: reverse transcriptase domain-containing protein [unclassified Frankia]MBL7487432.1 hypothetical protein [Frankia sp. AgW1.1]MBL7551050.1 hypothetical protein [Frankia sp. AgB1.9]MBL7618831.1 hypothetical protein [Frankia sp. AgB1.8]
MPKAMAQPRVLWAAWARVAAGSGMPGADGLSVADFARDLGLRLDRLGDQLAEGRYEPQPLRLATITRGGRRRRLGLPTVRDRVAQRAFLEVCREELDADAVEVSFAYRRGRSCLDALAAAERHRDEGRRVVLRTDIADYFARIRHDLLLGALPSGLSADGVALVRAWIAAPLLTEHGLVARTRGATTTHTINTEDLAAINTDRRHRRSLSPSPIAARAATRSASAAVSLSRAAAHVSSRAARSARAPSTRLHARTRPCR